MVKNLKLLKMVILESIVTTVSHLRQKVLLMQKLLLINVTQ